MVSKKEKKQPVPLTGRRTPDWSDPALSSKVERAIIAMDRIWVDHEPQLAIIAQLREYIAMTRNSLGRPIAGRRPASSPAAARASRTPRVRRCRA